MGCGKVKYYTWTQANLIKPYAEESFGPMRIYKCKFHPKRRTKVYHLSRIKRTDKLEGRFGLSNQWVRNNKDLANWENEGGAL